MPSSLGCRRVGASRSTREMEFRFSTRHRAAKICARCVMSMRTSLSTPMRGLRRDERRIARGLPTHAATAPASVMAKPGKVRMNAKARLCSKVVGVEYRQCTRSANIYQYDLPELSSVFHLHVTLIFCPLLASACVYGCLASSTLHDTFDPPSNIDGTFDPPSNILLVNSVMKRPRRRRVKGVMKLPRRF